MSVSKEELKRTINEFAVIDAKIKQYKDAVKQLNSRKKDLKEVIDTFMTENNLQKISINSLNTVINKVKKTKVAGASKKFVQQRLIDYAQLRGFDGEELVNFIYNPEFRDQEEVEDIKFKSA